MGGIKEMKIGTKILGTLVIMLVLLAVVAGIGILKMRSIGSAIEDIAGKDLPLLMGVNEVNRIHLNQLVLFGRAQEQILGGDQKGLKETEDALKNLTGKAADASKKLLMVVEKVEKEAKTSAAKTNVQELSGNARNFVRNVEGIEQAIGKIFVFSKAEKFKETLALTERITKDATLMQQEVDGFIGKIERSAGITMKAAREDQSAGISAIAVFSAIAMAIGLAFGVLVTTGINRALNRVVVSLSEGATQVSSASGQLSSSSQGLAEGSSEQAASLEETSSAMEEMSAMTRRNAESAGQAKSLADRAGASVEKSNASMQSLVTSMAEISRMGEETGKIIKTIDEIAFQTNLLALNAAVEAARAGEAGAGFAVVADEVRNLAQRAAGAAQNTSELIEGTIKKIKDGTVLVEKTNVDFGEVASAVTKVTELVGEISAASSEQSRGIDEVSRSIGQMDKVTQGNAANAEEIASASEELSAQSLLMEEVVRSLQSLVKGEGNAARQAASVTHDAPASRRKQMLPSRSAQPPADRTARASIGRGKPAGGNGKYPGGNGKIPPAQNPEDLIPMEENSMSDF